MTEQLDGPLWQLVQENERQSKTSIATVHLDGQQAQMAIVMAIALAVLLLLVVGVMVYRAVLGPILHTRITVLQIAEHNDFTQRFGDAGKDEVGDMVGSLNALIEPLQQTLGCIRDDMTTVRRAVESVADASANVANGSAHQHDSTESMAAVEEMTVSINHIAGNANAVMTLSCDAGDVSRQGDRGARSGVAAGLQRGAGDPRHCRPHQHHLAHGRGQSCRFGRCRAQLASA
ncbi:methyl-accepting chemotaxis protein [Crenobacter sp. SG2305]|uniref:HAMP domain-containing protein n=1 Tax=Crenobacter oryzisoli TaxID=3056844 RepID=UPI0025AB2610|nr:methyl-accepting chemotaxis protein [Crenobacter sp. SG2305]MDN0081462.1 methyl-accepting chemotaxis protein [Crenobacter sp. SG2305]